MSETGRSNNSTNREEDLGEEGNDDDLLWIIQLLEDELNDRPDAADPADSNSDASGDNVDEPAFTLEEIAVLREKTRQYIYDASVSIDSLNDAELSRLFKRFEIRYPFAEFSSQPNRHDYLLPRPETKRGKYHMVHKRNRTKGLYRIKELMRQAPEFEFLLKWDELAPTLFDYTRKLYGKYKYRRSARLSIRRVRKVVERIRKSSGYPVLRTGNMMDWLKRTYGGRLARFIDARAKESHKMMGTMKTVNQNHVWSGFIGSLFDDGEVVEEEDYDGDDGDGDDDDYNDEEEEESDEEEYMHPDPEDDSDPRGFGGGCGDDDGPAGSSGIASVVLQA